MIRFLTVREMLAQRDDIKYVAYVNSFGSIHKYFIVDATDYQGAINKILQIGWDREQIKVVSATLANSLIEITTVEQWQSLK